MLDIFAAETVPVPKKSALETSRGGLSEDVSFGIGTLLVAEESSLESAPGVCDIHCRIRYLIGYAGSSSVRNAIS